MRTPASRYRSTSAPTAPCTITVRPGSASTASSARMRGALPMAYAKRTEATPAARFPSHQARISLTTARGSCQRYSGSAKVASVTKTSQRTTSKGAHVGSGARL
jgi:hypothetical protein